MRLRRLAPRLVRRMGESRATLASAEGGASCAPLTAGLPASPGVLLLTGARALGVLLLAAATAGEARAAKRGRATAGDASALCAALARFCSRPRLAAGAGAGACSRTLVASPSVALAAVTALAGLEAVAVVVAVAVWAAARPPRLALPLALAVRCAGARVSASVALRVARRGRAGEAGGCASSAAGAAYFFCSRVSVFAAASAACGEGEREWLVCKLCVCVCDVCVCVCV